MKSRLLRFIQWLRDSLPLYSYRACSRAWLDGREQGRREVGIARDAFGRFTKISS